MDRSSGMRAVGAPRLQHASCYNHSCGIYEGRSKSFAIQYDVQMAQTKELHYF